MILLGYWVGSSTICKVSKNLRYVLRRTTQDLTRGIDLYCIPLFSDCLNTMLEIINIEKVSSFVGSGKMQR